MRIATLSAAALLLLCFACGQAAAQTPKPFSVVDVSYTESHTLVYFTSNKSYGYVSSQGALAAGETVAVVVDRNPTASGWDYIRFTADAAYVAQNQSEAFYAVGFAEGVLTSDSIYSSYVTSMSEDGLPWLNTLVADGSGKMWLDNHVAFMRNLGNTNTSTYGVMVKSLLRQIDGLYDGYNAAVRNSSLPALTWTQMFLISFQSEISRAADGAAAIYSTGSSSSGTSDFAITRMFPNLAPILGHSKKRRAQGTHCSALVRTTGDDVLLAHDTWSSYNTMVRQYKTYTFGTTYSVTMSGYPASLSSIDDWYMTQSKLAVTETSIDLETNQLDSLVRPESVSEFMRAMLANYLASSAPEWALIFSDHNSGTYNNQYMILDTKLAAQKLSNQSLVYNTLLPDTFWVLEQSPGLIVKEDQTDFLNTNKHWPSYNIPFYEQIYNRSGFAAAEISTGSLNNYTTYARARLFKRLFESVVDVASMYHVMRYNEWRTDEESLIPWCVTKQYGTCTHNRSAMLSIASRGDLAPAEEGEGPASVGGQPLADAVTLMNLGAIDTKITSVRNMMGTENIGFAINGPTSQSQPIFNTTAFIAANSQPNGILEGVSWRGVPSYFDFPFSRFLPEMETPAPLPTMAPTPGPKDDNDDSKSRVAIAVGVVAGVGVVGGGSIFAYRKFSRSKHEIYEGEESPLV